MKATREQLWLGFGLVAAGAAAAWFFLHSEWVDVPVYQPAKGEAARDPLYAVKRIAAELGAKIQSPAGLESLPPPGATLVLSAFRGSLFPERRQALSAWVERGGHLVVPSWFVEDEDEALAWLPMRRVERPEHADREQREPAQPRPGERKRPCPRYDESEEAAPAFERLRGYRLCARFPILLETTAPMLWAIDDDDGHVWLRAALGRGSVTAIGDYGVMEMPRVLENDHAVALVAALQVRPGAELWFVRAEDRPPLLVLIWEHGAPAVLLGALALGLALWRNALRFGPLLAEPPRARRSVAEQVRGTAGFIFRRGGAALHAAAVRALEETAARTLPASATNEPARRIAAIAAAAGVDADALRRALDTADTPPRGQLPALLALLETARRRLAARHRSTT